MAISVFGNFGGNIHFQLEHDIVILVHHLEWWYAVNLDIRLYWFLSALPTIWSTAVAFLRCYDSWLRSIFEASVTLRFIRRMHNRILHVLFWPSLIHSKWTVALPTAISWCLTNWRHLINGCRAKILHHSKVITVDGRWHSVEGAWTAVFVHDIQSLFDSMPREISADIVRGG